MPRRARSLYAWGLAAAALSAGLIQYRSRAAEAADPPRGGFLEVGGARLHYVDRGLGTPVVLLHGLGTMAEDFEASGLLAAASRHHRVIAFDRPGYGYSTRPRRRVWGPQAQAELLHGALQRLGVARPVVMGHSWGTLVAAAYALRYPDAVRSLVLVSGYYYPTARIDAPVFATAAIPGVGAALRHTVSPWLARAAWPWLLRRMFAPDPVPPDGRRPPTWMLLRPSQLRAAAAEAALTLPAARALMHRYSELSVPVHIVAGGADQYVSTPTHSERLHRDIAGSAYTRVPGHGHMLHYVAHEALLAVIDAAAVPHAGTMPAMEDAGKAVETLPSGSDVYKRL